MGWEQRGNNSYYYKKEREGSRVKSVYVGSGKVAHVISKLQSSSKVIWKYARTIRSPEQVKREKAETALEDASDLIQLITQAALLTAGFHTHKDNGGESEMPAEVECTKLANVDQIRAKFKDLLAKTNKEHPRVEDVKALSELLSGNKSLELGARLQVPVNWLNSQLSKMQ